MKRIVLTILCAGILLGSLQGIASAASAPPAILTYQGRLANGSGDLLGSSSGTTYYFKFSVWDSVSSGNRIWPTSAPTSVSATVRQGAFTVNIGDTANGYPTSLSLDFSNHSALYLQVEVSSDNTTFETLSPRQQITAAAYAQVAGAVVGTTTQSALGTTTPYGASQLTLAATTSSATPLSILGSPSQSAALLQVLDNSFAHLFSINSSGGVFASSSLAVGGTLQFTNFSSCTLKTNSNGNVTCGSDLGGVGQEINWSWFNGSGIRLGTTTNQVLVGALATSTLAALEVHGWTSLENASSTSFSANTLAVGGTGTTSVSSTGALSTPSLTVGSLTGILKATNGLISVATAGVDYTNFSYLFPSNATTTAITFSGGLTTTNASTTALSSNTLAIGGTATATISSAGVLTLPTALAVTSGGTGATSLNDLITLGAYTTGNYLATLSSSGSITVGNSGSESAAATVNLNLANENIWTALQQFNRASTTLASVYDTLYIGRTSTSTVSSTAVNLASSGSYQINGASVLNATTLGSAVVNSSLTSVGTLSSLTVSGQTTLGNASTTAFSSNTLVAGGTGTTSISSAGLLTTPNLYATGSSTVGGTLNAVGGATFGSVTLSGITGSTQCLRVNSSGTVSGAGADCGSGSGAGNWFTPTTNYGALANATTTSVWFQAGLQASSTSQIAYASSTAATIASLFGTNAQLFGSSTIGDGTQTGGLTVSGGATTTGNAYIGGTLGVTGSATVAGNLTLSGTGLNGNLSVGSDADVSGSFTVLGRTTLRNASTTNVSGNTLAFGGTATTTIDANGSLAVGGNFTGAGLTGCNNSTQKLLWANGQFSCGTDLNTGGGGGSFPFSATTNYGQVVYATSTPTLWFQSGFFASSTSQIAYASTTALGVSGALYVGALDGPLQANNGAVSATTSVGAVYGGTGQSSYTTGDILYASAANTLSKLTIGSAGQVLKISGGVPAWGTDLTSSGAAGIFSTTTDSLAIYPSTVSNVLLLGTAATTTTGNILEVLGSSLFRGALTTYNTLTAPSFTATSTSVASTLPYASTTALTVSGLASTSNLIVSLLPATVLSTNGSGVAQATTISAPLSFSGSTLSITQSGSGANGYLSSTDWNTFNNKISSTSLSAAGPITYNSSSGAIGFDTSVANSFTGLQQFRNASSTLFSVNGTAYFGGTATSTIDSTGSLTIAGNFNGAGLSTCASASDKLLWNAGQFSCGTDSGGGAASELNWTFFNGSGVRLGTTSNQVVIGATATSSGVVPTAGLNVIGGAGIDFATTTALFSTTASSTNLSVGNNAVVYNNLGIGSSTPYAKLAVTGGNIVQTAAGSSTIATSTWSSGNTYASVVQGRYVYVADNSGGVKVFDNQNPNRLTLAGSYTGVSGAVSIAVAGSYAYVGDTSAGLVILDVRNPANIVQVGSYAAGDTYGLALSGKYVFASNFSGGNVRVIDVSDPTSPKLASTISTGGAPYGLYAKGSYLYVASQTSPKFQIVDTSNPAASSVVGTLSTGLNFPTAVTVSGRYAYVGDATKGLQIIDVATPSAPSIVGSVDTGAQYYGIAVAGNYVYAADYGGRMKLIDVADPATPRVVATTTLAAGTPKGVTIAGKHAYIANDNQGLAVIDINGIEAPSASIGNLLASGVNVSDDLSVGNNIYAGGGLNVGISGIFSRGTIAAYIASSTQSNATVASFMGGRVAIGTTTPGNLFAVQGSGLFSGDLNLANLTATGTLSALNLSLSGSATTSGSLYVAASTTVAGAFNAVGNSTLGFATTTNLAITGTPSVLLKTLSNGAVVAAVAGTDYVTPGALSINREWNIIANSYLAPTTTLGIIVNASSTIGNGTQTGGLTVSGGATTTGNAYFAGNLGVGINAPGFAIDISGYANVSAAGGYKQNGSTVLFASSTNITLAVGAPEAAAWMTATSGAPWYTVAIGQGALGTTPVNTSATNNTAIGYNALNKNTAGSNNVALGAHSLYNNTTGSENFALGASALYNNNGDYNVAVGSGVLGANTSGSYNIGIGRLSLQYSTTGANNIGIGGATLNVATSSSNNTAIGYYAGAGISGATGAVGGNNTLIGYQAGTNITTGSNNTVLGTFSGSGSVTTGSDNILIGNDVKSGLDVAGSNQLNIGNLLFGTGVSSGSTISSGAVGIGTSSPYAKLSVVGQTVAAYFTATTSTASSFPYASSTALTVSGTGYFGTASTTALRISNTQTFENLASASLAVNASGQVYAAATTTFSGGLTYSGGNVTADLGTSVSVGELASADFGSFTCNGSACTVDSGAISNAMLANSTISGVALGQSLNALTATNGTLTFSGSYDGSTARTVGLNLANANTWTALQQFSQASSSQLSALSAYFGATGTTTITSDGWVGVGTSTPWAKLSINPIAGDGPSFAIGSSTATLFVVDNAGRVGIGTSTPFSKLGVQNTAAAAQWSLAYDATNYSQMYVRASTGDLFIQSSGQDNIFNNDNLWVCYGPGDITTSNCPSGAPTDAGNLLVENKAGIGTSTPAAKLVIEASDALTNLFQIASTTNQNIFRVNANGRVGIGTSTPFARLAVGAGGAIVTTENALTDGGTIAVDWLLGNQQRVTLGGNRSVTFSNYTDGQILRLVLCQDATGGRTVSWPAVVLWNDGTTPTLTNTANKCDLLTFVATQATSTLKVFGAAALNF